LDRIPGAISALAPKSDLDGRFLDIKSSNRTRPFQCGPGKLPPTPNGGETDAPLAVAMTRKP
jgi:hypothetical protein